MAAKVILSMDGLVLKEIPINKERMTIGRRPVNDIQIDNLAISGQHAVIITILNDSFLEDLNSTNGTYVNGQLVKKHVLQHNDIIELGKYRLKFINELPAGGVADFEKTMVLRPDILRKTREQLATKDTGDTQLGSMKNMVSATQTNVVSPPSTAPAITVTKVPSSPAATNDKQSSPTTTTTQVVPPMAKTATVGPAASVPPAPENTGSGEVFPDIGMIQVLSGSSAGREMALTKSVTTIGKPGIQVAVIARRAQGYFITHVEGAKTPAVNGRNMDAHSHKLADHDVIEVAGVKMEFYFKRP